MVSLFGDEVVSRNEDIANGVVSFHSFVCMEVTVLPASFLLSLGARKIMGAVFYRLRRSPTKTCSNPYRSICSPRFRHPRKNDYLLQSFGADALVRDDSSILSFDNHCVIILL